MRRFTLLRIEDETGVSGTGVVAQGVEFDDGVVALRWLTEWPTSVVFHERGAAAVEHIHGHGGKTQVIWHDEERSPAVSSVAETRPPAGPDGRYWYICEQGHRIVTSEPCYEACTAGAVFGLSEPAEACGADIEWRMVPYDHAAEATTVAPPAPTGCMPPLQSEVERLSALGENWDGYHASPPTDQALDVLRHLQIVPCTDGGVQVDIYANGWETELTFSPQGRPTCFISEQSTAATPSPAVTPETEQ